MYRLLDGYTPPYCRYKPEPVLGLADMIWYWDRSGITDKTVDVNRPDRVLIDREINTAFVMDIAVPLTQKWDRKNDEIWKLVTRKKYLEA